MLGHAHLRFVPDINSHQEEGRFFSGQRNTYTDMLEVSSGLSAQVDMVIIISLVILGTFFFILIY